MNFYPFHVGDYASHTRHLTLMGDLAYRRLLDLYYLSEMPLPLDPAECARRIGMRDHIQDVSEVLSDFFLKSEDGYHSKRCDTEIQSYKAKSERAKSANLSRWSNKKSDSSLKSDSVQIATNNQEPITNIKNPPTPLEGGSDVFDRFWVLYPKKVGKEAARRAWKKIKEPVATFSLISEALAWQSGSHEWKREHGQYVPNPSTYLNQGRWMDEKRDNPPDAGASTSKQQGIPWWSTDQTIITKGKEHGLEPRPGELMAQFKGRVADKISQTNGGTHG